MSSSSFTPGSHEKCPLQAYRSAAAKDTKNGQRYNMVRTMASRFVQDATFLERGQQLVTGPESTQTATQRERLEQAINCAEAILTGSCQKYMVRPDGSVGQKLSLVPEKQE